MTPLVVLRRLERKAHATDGELALAGDVPRVRVADQRNGEPHVADDIVDALDEGIDIVANLPGHVRLELHFPEKGTRFAILLQQKQRARKLQLHPRAVRALQDRAERLCRGLIVPRLQKASAFKERALNLRVVRRLAEHGPNQSTSEGGGEEGLPPRAHSLRTLAAEPAEQAAESVSAVMPATLPEVTLPAV